MNPSEGGADWAGRDFVTDGLWGMRERKVPKMVVAFPESGKNGR